MAAFVAEQEHAQGLPDARQQIPVRGRLLLRQLEREAVGALRRCNCPFIVRCESACAGVRLLGIAVV
ncbi:MAG: hypothetical protein JO363_03645 [Solirubrobacterales bacterium]|nr:hypothetical protein [Solirubrobacterales bacterium]